MSLGSAILYIISKLFFYFCFRSLGQIQGNVGILGHQTREAALAILHNCPLLEDMTAWSHWPLVFEPQFGKLKDFVNKYGGEKNIPLEGMLCS